MPESRKSAPNQALDLTVSGKKPRSAEFTQAAILAAAIEEFSENGFSGARVDTIALRAKTNKRMLYHYFSDKAGLYLAALEQIFTEILTTKMELDLKSREPEDAIRQLAFFIWSYFLAHPHFVTLISTENQLKGKYIKKSKKIPALHSEFMEELADIVNRGIKTGVFRSDTDPSLVLLTILSMSFYYINNKHTIEVNFGHDTSSPEAIKSWGEHIVATTLASLK